MKVLFHNKLGRIWFLVWFIGISIYLIVKAIRRYIDFKTLQFDKVFEREIDESVMNFYLTCIIISIFLSILCVYCTVFPTGNYANDSMQFGRGVLDFKVMKMKFEQEDIEQNSCWKRLKSHSPPYHLSLYFAMSVFTFLALPYLDAEKIKNKMSKIDSPRYSNLDILFNSIPDNKDGLSNQFTSFEFFNICISLILHTFSYSHVFWKYSKKFSLLFSFVIFLSGMIFVLDTALVEMLIKVSRTSYHNIYIMSPAEMTILSVLAYFLLIIHQMALFEYCFLRITETFNPRLSIETSEGCAVNNDGLNLSTHFLSVCKQVCVDPCRGVLLPFVIGIFAIVLNICFRLFYLYKSMTTMYFQFKDSLILTNLIVAVLFLLLMMILWVSLLLRSRSPIKPIETMVESNGNCSIYITRHPNNVPSLPIYASIKRKPMSSPPMGQEPNFPIFCDAINNQWRYSCSPPSCGQNDSNSDRTTSCKNGDIGNNNKNYIVVRRTNPVVSVVESPNMGHGIYSQLIKLTPQNNQVENNHSDNVMTYNSIPNDISDSSSNQTVHIIGPVTLDMSRGTLDRSSGRNRVMTSSEYFNILNYAPIPGTGQDIYDQGTSINTDVDSSNLCSQV